MKKKHKPLVGDYVMAEYYKAELAKVKKQLAIAVEGLMTITDNGDSLWDIQQAQWYLEKIKELNK